MDDGVSPAQIAVEQRVRRRSVDRWVAAYRFRPLPPWASRRRDPA
ncbi:MAG TPA: hypothetical protein VG722_11520 [Tepidisphaeraceae bacterium]|nr:hypothetical protein [Tepidisphaeraceae bacterium]